MSQKELKTKKLDAFCFSIQVHVKSDGIPVASSPFLIRVGDPGKVQVAHVRSEELFAERVIKNEVDLAVESPYDMDDDQLTAKVTSPDLENVPCIVTRGTDNRHHVKFTPHKPGPYKVMTLPDSSLIGNNSSLLLVTQTISVSRLTALFYLNA